MTARTIAAPRAAPAAGRTWRGIPVVLPSVRDPRLHVSAVIMSLQVLGQVALEFKVSIAQILVTIAAAALVEVGITFWRRRALIWPGSALLTGNGVAFILRTSGTEHGDWWSMNGIHFFVAAALVGLLSKYLLRVGDRHLFNPSNFGLIVVLLVVGPPWVFPQYLFWGNLTPPVLASLAVILVGVVWILRPLKMLGMASAFLVPFYALIAALAIAGRCMNAIWHAGPICGGDYWYYIATSPELLIFVFYMMSDPMTAPRPSRARIVYGALTAFTAAALIAFQPTEFGVKVALLGALTMVCAGVPLIEHVFDRAGARDPVRPQALLRCLAAEPVVVAVALVAITIPIGLAGLAGNEQLLNLERGIVPGEGTFRQ